MKAYEGRRTIDGLVVTVDGEILNDRQDVKSFSIAGIEWGYVGDAPKQLALVLLCDHLDDNALAIEKSDEFMRDVVAILDNDWTLNSENIQTAINKEQTN
ncbi:DUF6166 domain-containing protein [Rhodospirillales bacterium]|nr:DUF6166 domain-containing protein [Rhodospirillales bacterium]